MLSPEEEESIGLAEGIEDKELTMAQETGARDDEDDALVDKDLKEWLDEVSNKMSEEEQLVLAENIRPVSSELCSCQGM